VSTRPLRSVLFLCLAAGLVRAQDPRFGVQLGLNLPFGDLGDAVDNRQGYTFGAHVGLYYGNGHELRPRLEYTLFEGGWQPSGNRFDKNTITAFGLGADYVYYTELRPAGFYLLMGLGNQWWQVSPKSGPSESNSGIYLSAGAGYRTNRAWAFEGRCSTGQFRDGHGQATQLQAVATFRF
jgi:hypothetical protein